MRRSRCAGVMLRGGHAERVGRIDLEPHPTPDVANRLAGDERDRALLRRQRLDEGSRGVFLQRKRGQARVRRAIGHTGRIRAEEVRRRATVIFAPSTAKRNETW